MISVNPYLCTKRVFSDNVTLFVTPDTFENRGHVYNLYNHMTAEDVRDIERFFEVGTPNQFGIKVDLNTVTALICERSARNIFRL